MPQLQDTISVPAKAVALYDNTAETAEELSFRAGDLLTILVFDYSGYEGWWLCSLRGTKGICPGNRLRILNEAEGQKGDSMKKSWSHQNKAVSPPVESYMYDQPKSVAPIQYDVVPSNPQPVEEAERYDVPRSLGGTCSPPPSHVPSPVPEQYDIPRPAQPVPPTPTLSVSQYFNQPPLSSPQPSQEAISGIIEEQEYSVPAEVELEQGIAWLGRLEEEAESAIRGILGCAVSNWRKTDMMNTVEVRTAVQRVRLALRQLALFARSALVSCRHRLTANKLTPLVEAVSKADNIVEGSAADLDIGGWTSELLCETLDGGLPNPDPLGTVVSTVASVQHDVAALASFIQGNATLLFKKPGESSGKNAQEDYDFVAVDKDQPDLSGSAPPLTMDPADVKVLKFYGGQYAWEVGELGSAVGLFLESVEQNQPPRVFLDHIKFILLAGGRLVGLVDAASKAISSKRLGEGLSVAGENLIRALTQVWRTTAQAAHNFPNISTVQKMVNSVYTLSDHARQTRHSLRPQ